MQCSSINIHVLVCSSPTTNLGVFVACVGRVYPGRNSVCSLYKRIQMLFIGLESAPWICAQDRISSIIFLINIEFLGQPIPIQVVTTSEEDDNNIRSLLYCIHDAPRLDETERRKELIKIFNVAYKKCRAKTRNGDLRGNAKNAIRVKLHHSPATACLLHYVLRENEGARARKRDPFILWPIIAKLRLVVGVNSSRAPVCGKHSTYMFKWMALEWVSPIAFYLFDSPIKCPLRLLEKIKRWIRPTFHLIQKSWRTCVGRHTSDEPVNNP